MIGYRISLSLNPTVMLAQKRNNPLQNGARLIDMQPMAGIIDSVNLRIAKISDDGLMMARLQVIGIATA